MRHRAPGPPDPDLSSVLPACIYEVNTLVWLREVSERAGRTLTLAEVPAPEWDAVVLEGVDCVWLMGVWTRSLAGRAVALDNEELRRSWDVALPGWTEADVVSSPYCIGDYVCDPELGGREGLAAARTALAERGARLIVDLVPNHVSPDHPLLTTRPQAFVLGTAEDLAGDPVGFLEVPTGSGSVVVARARDPYFPPWPDVVQLNAFAPSARTFLARTLIDIAEQADGVRCDMAMLLLDDVFAGTWGDRVGEPLGTPLWVEVLAAVRLDHPSFAVVAEAYWGREPDLLAQGFDACYDKTLYDRLLAGSANEVRAHLSGMDATNAKTVRFLENHDEPRAASALQPEGRGRAASVALATLPGATLWHEGQLDGRHIRLPVFLGRRPDEEFSTATRDFLTRLIAAAPAVRGLDGAWSLLDTSGWNDNASHESLLAWTWNSAEHRSLVVINLSGSPAQGIVALGAGLAGRHWSFVDALDGTTYDRDGDDLATQGLFVDLAPWSHHVWSSQWGTDAGR